MEIQVIKSPPSPRRLFYTVVPLIGIIRFVFKTSFYETRYHLITSTAYFDFPSV